MTFSATIFPAGDRPRYTCPMPLASRRPSKRYGSILGGSAGKSSRYPTLGLPAITNTAALALIIRQGAKDGRC